MRFVEHDGVQIAFEELGRGRPLVLGHSFLCSGEMWAPQLPSLAAEHRVLNVDLRGHGSSGIVRRPFTLYDMVADVLAVLDRAGVDRAVWVGLSIGGMVALRAALSAPDRVAALVLLDTDAGPERPWNRVKYTGLGWVARVFGIRPVLPQVARQMFGRTTLRTRGPLVREWTDRFARVDVPSALRMLRALKLRDDLLPRLSEIAAPTLVLVGQEDASLPPERSRRLAAAVPGARLVEIPEAGHLSTLEQPHAVTTAMLDFLGGLPAPA